VPLSDASSEDTIELEISAQQALSLSRADAATAYTSSGNSKKITPHYPACGSARGVVRGHFHYRGHVSFIGRNRIPGDNPSRTPPCQREYRGPLGGCCRDPAPAFR
jgi:hypothetical protein